MRLRAALLLKKRPGTHSLCRLSVCAQWRLRLVCVLCSYQMRVALTQRRARTLGGILALEGRLIFTMTFKKNISFWSTFRKYI